MYGGRLARCNDESITERKDCVGVFVRKIFVTKMKLEPLEGEKYPAMLVPRVWWVSGMLLLGGRGQGVPLLPVWGQTFDC